MNAGKKFQVLHHAVGHPGGLFKGPCPMFPADWIAGQVERGQVPQSPVTGEPLDDFTVRPVRPLEALLAAQIAGGLISRQR